MKIIITTVLLVTSVTAEALDLKGVSPGQPWEPKVLEDKLNVDGSAKATGNVVDDAVNNAMRVHCDETSCTGWATYGACPGNTTVESKDGKTVETISVEISVNCYDRVTALMLKKYGPVSNTRRQVKQNSFGARVSDVILFWQKGDQTLLYEKYKSIDQSFIFLTGPQKPEKEGTL